LGTSSYTYVLTAGAEATFADLDIAQFSDPAFAAAFEADFASTVAAAAGVSAADVTVTSIHPGSVLVTFVVAFPTSQRDARDALTTALELSPSEVFANANSTLTVYGEAATTPGSVASEWIALSPPPPPPSACALAGTCPPPSPPSPPLPPPPPPPTWAARAIERVHDAPEATTVQFAFGGSDLPPNQVPTSPTAAPAPPLTLPEP